jgi:hypothetical protein
MCRRYFNDAAANDARPTPVLDVLITAVYQK